MKTLSAPLSVTLGITDQCNLNCKHCFASSTRKSRNLTTPELFKIIDEIERLKIPQVGIFGGEPLMKKDFFILLERLSKLKATLFLNTNGTLITERIAHRLSRYPIRTYTVSLDGSCAEVQDPFRGRGSFEKTVAGIRHLMAQKLHVVINAIVTRFNHRDVENIVLLGKQLGVHEVRFNDVAYIGNAACYHDSLVMTVAEKFKLIKTLQKLRKRFGGFMQGSLVQICDIMNEIKRSPKESFPLRVESCGAATAQCVIRPDGKVVTCVILWEEIAGDIRKQSLHDIWHHAPVMKAFRKAIVIKEAEIPECKGCEYLRLCYKGHRCQPYFQPGAKFERKELYCWREDVVGAK